jgi:hypothetical protein
LYNKVEGQAQTAITQKTKPNKALEKLPFQNRKRYYIAGVSEDLALADSVHVIYEVFVEVLM